MVGIVPHLSIVEGKCRLRNVDDRMNYEYFGKKVHIAIRTACLYCFLLLMLGNFLQNKNLLGNGRVHDRTLTTR